MAYLQSVDYAAGIVAVDDGPVFRIQSAELVDESGKSFCSKAFLHGAADVVTDGGNVVDALAYGIDVHHAATGEEGHIGVGEEAVEETEDILLVV